MSKGGVPSPISNFIKIQERSRDIWDEIESDMEFSAHLDLQCWLQEIDLAAVYEDENVVLKEDGYVIVAEEDLWLSFIEGRSNQGVLSRRTSRMVVSNAYQYHREVLENKVGQEVAARITAERDAGVVLIHED